ncbi:hypothetical protein JHK87_039010 [Glycine soja]|nr:hypothetical protein JHK87_039010 [Glycine soja]
MKTQPVSGWICVALVFWVLGGGDGVAFWSRGKPLHSRKQLPEEAQPASRMVCIMATRREEWVPLHSCRLERKQCAPVLFNTSTYMHDDISNYYHSKKGRREKRKQQCKVHLHIAFLFAMLVGMIMKGIELVRSLKKDDKGAPIEWHFCYAYHSSTWMHGFLVKE